MKVFITNITTDETGVCCGDCPFCVYDPLPNCKLWGWELSECDNSMYDRCRKCREKLTEFLTFLQKPMASPEGGQ